MKQFDPRQRMNFQIEISLKKNFEAVLNAKFVLREEMINN